METTDGDNERRRTSSDVAMAECFTSYNMAEEKTDFRGYKTLQPFVEYFLLFEYSLLRQYRYINSVTIAFH